MIPKPLRERVGLRAGAVDVTVEGTGLRIEPLASERLDERDGRLVITAGASGIDDEAVRSLRDAGQR